jgi:hypothetical protein
MTDQVNILGGMKSGFFMERGNSIYGIRNVYNAVKTGIGLAITHLWSRRKHGGIY